MKTKPRGIHATFTTDCPRCEGEVTVTNGRPDPHQCEPRTDMGAWQDALGDYYDSGAIGTPPPRSLYGVKFPEAK